MSEPLYPSLGQVLKARRTELKLSLRVVGKRSGIHFTKIARLETDASNIKLSDYRILCGVLKIRVRIIL